MVTLGIKLRRKMAVLFGILLLNVYPRPKVIIYHKITSSITPLVVGKRATNTQA
jgi:hypothetical protein